MWISPNHPNPPQPIKPRLSGEVLATFPRRGPEGQEQELRIVQDAYHGRRYLAVRLWQRDRVGGWWPLRGKGVSIRLSEAAGVAEALRRVEGLADHAPAEDRPRFVERNRRPQPREYHPHGGPAPRPGFDECGDEPNP